MTVINQLKRYIKSSLRSVKDLFSGELFATKANNELDFPHSLIISQEIKPSETFDNKVFNLSLASKVINQYYIQPNEVFSFWKIVGNPSKDYKKSRSIQNGQVSEDIGGGLCQVSGIIYHASLEAGLKIIERYNHSLDLYTDETRFTPLGLDATVVYGYKDLRVKNPYSFPLKFELTVDKNRIQIQVKSKEAIEPIALFFETEQNEKHTTVIVKDENGKTLNRSNYLKLNKL